MTTCLVCTPPAAVIQAMLGLQMITLDAVPHPAGLFTVAELRGLHYASPVRRDESPGTRSRHRIHIHRTEKD